MRLMALVPAEIIFGEFSLLQDLPLLIVSHAINE